uniref:Uncharacterized protein n=1 Tax=Rhizophora mucronata TaxID=61149 RepID=A0A2P2QD39_RHIMU
MEGTSSLHRKFCCKIQIPTFVHSSESGNLLLGGKRGI